MLSELDSWCHERLTGDVWLAVLRDVLDGAYRIEHRTAADLEYCIELPLTLDHRHFGTMRPRHVEALELLPADS